MKAQLRDEAYAVLAEQLTGKEDHSEELLRGAAIIVIEDDRKGRTSAERFIQQWVAVTYLVSLIIEADDAEPKCP